MNARFNARTPVGLASPCDGVSDHPNWGSGQWPVANGPVRRPTADSPGRQMSLRAIHPGGC